MKATCDQCSAEFESQPHHMIVDVKSQRIAMRRHWVFCSPRCRDRWWDSGDSADFAEIDNPDTIVEKAEKEKVKRGIKSTLVKKAPKRELTPEQIKAGHKLDPMVEARYEKNYGYRQLGVPCEDKTDEEVEAEEHVRKRAPMFWCAHGDDTMQYDRDLQVKIIRHSGKQGIDAADVSFSCPCHMNSWWKKAGG